MGTGWPISRTKRAKMRSRSGLFPTRTGGESRYRFRVAQCRYGGTLAANYFFEVPEVACSPYPSS